MAASIRILKRRIKTARNIAQITRAMEMVAASKMRRAQERTLAGKPYESKLRTLVQNMVGRIEGESHPYLTKREKGKILMLVFSSDKGLCGSFNTNLLRSFLRFIAENGEIEVLSIGRKLQRPIARSGGLLVADFPIGSTLPTFEHVLPIANFIVDVYMRQEYRSVVALYMRFSSLSKQETIVQTILPIQKEIAQGVEATIIPYHFEPNPKYLLTSLFPHYLEMSLYQMFLESYASEQAARMIAMHQASDNAKEVVFELSLTYNRVRQERITNELLDITTATMGLGV